jgi:oligosaccharyl transferase (archaeosortase A-associated)
VFLETDPYYHMWRVFSYIDTFPRTSVFDPYINYPHGALVGWPPLFDQITALISIIIGLGGPDIRLVETIGAFMPVAFGIFSIVAVYFITKEIFNENAALFSSLLIAVIPAHVQISFLGFTDHHIAEVLFSVLAYMFFIRSLNTGSLRYAIVSGIIIGISFLTWQGAPIFMGILLSYAIIQFVLDRKSNDRSDYLVFTGTVSFVSAILVMLIFYIWTPWQHSITSGALSYFQLLFLAISAVTILLSGMIAGLVKEKKWFYYLLIIFALFASIFLLIYIAIPSLYLGISNGIGYLLRDAPVLKQISEAQPLFYTFDGKFLGWQFFSNPVWNAFTLSFYFGVSGFLWFLYSLRNGMDKGKLFLAVWTLIVLVLALFQRRFSYMLAVNIALLSGFFLDDIMRKAGSIPVKSNLKKYFPSFIYLFFVLILILPNIALSNELSKYPPRPSDDWYDSLVWLKDNTPEITDEERYGIMAWWDYGNWILYISKRPVVANNFQIGGDEAARFFVEQDETLANTIMDNRNARYVIVDHRMGLNKFRQGDKIVLRGTFMAVASFADKDISSYLDENNLPNRNYLETMYARMHVFDGNGLKNYRMVYESGETHYNLFDRSTKNIKIFEYVKGAAITGKASPDETVLLSGSVVTNQERTFEYVQEVKADNNGGFEFTVPYSKESRYETRLSNGYMIKYGNSSISIDVSENDIIRGNTIKVN